MEKLNVLNSKVPAGGRQLTSSECKSLRTLGVTCSEAYTVMPHAQDINHGGPLYKPARQGGLDNTGHVLGLK